ncbi:MAG: hypothetical protein ACXW5U_21155 [Thermoanaerobaculia bacterium]
MAAEAKRLFDEFRALPERSKREVLAELLQIARALDDSEIGRRADRGSGPRLSEYDRRGTIG